MQSQENEFSRPLDVTRVPAHGSVEKITAEPAELAALARRFGLPALRSLAAELHVSRWRGEGLKIKGRFAAELEQVCVVSLDVFASRLIDEVEGYFLPAKAALGADGLLIEEGDAEPFEDGIIDLGEVVAEAVALALDPYPRKPGTTFADRLEEEKAAPDETAKTSPFAGLDRLKQGKS